MSQGNVPTGIRDLGGPGSLSARPMSGTKIWIFSKLGDPVIFILIKWALCGARHIIFIVTNVHRVSRTAESSSLTKWMPRAGGAGKECGVLVYSDSTTQRTTWHFMCLVYNHNNNISSYMIIIIAVVCTDIYYKTARWWRWWR